VLLFCYFCDIVLIVLCNDYKCHKLVRCVLINSSSWWRFSSSKSTDES